MQIVVVGMHRSGTSALTRVLGLMGCWLGEPDEFNPLEPDNPKGYWERRDVWALNEAMLASQGATWCRVADFDLDRWDASVREGFEAQARAIVERLDGHTTWAIKDPRMCLLLPVWQAVLTRPVFVLMVRRPLQVARSLQTRDGFPLALGAALWEKHLIAALQYTAGRRRLLAYYEDLVGDPATTAADLLAGLESLGTSGLHLPESDALRSFVDPALFRAHGTGREEASLLNSVQHDLWRSLADGSVMRRADWPELSTGCDDLLRSWGAQSERFETIEAERAHAVGRTEELGDRVRQLEVAEARLPELESAHAEMRRHADGLEEQVASLEYHLGERDKTHEDSRRHAANLEKQVASLEQHLSERDKAHEDSRRHAADLEKQVASLEQQRREHEQAQHEARRLADGLEQQLRTSEDTCADARRRAEDLEQRLQGAEDQVLELSTELREALQRGEQLKQRARLAEDRARLVHDLRTHADSLYGELKRAANLFDQLHALLDLVLASRRYRMAEAIGQTSRRLTFRGAQPIAAEHATRILGEYETWRRQLVELHGLPPIEGGA